MNQWCSKYLIQVTTVTLKSAHAHIKCTQCGGLLYSKKIYNKRISRANIVQTPVAVLENLIDGHPLSLMVYSLFASTSGTSSAFLGHLRPW